MIHMPPRARTTAPAATPAGTSSAGLVTLNDVVDSDSMFRLVDGASTEFLAIAGFFGWMAPGLREKIEYQLHKEGLDQPGRFAFMQTSGARAAKLITDPLFKIADINIECAQLLQTAGMNWRTYYSEPRAQRLAMADEADVLGI